MLPLDNYIKPIPPKPISKPEPKPQAQPQTQIQTAVPTKSADIQYLGATNKFKLDKQYDATLPTPYGAVEEINNLPKPDPNDKAAVEKYKQQRKAIADDAINHSKPPKIEDFRNSGLNGRTAQYEYEQVRQGYDSQISDLKKISADAVRYPDTILTPSEAQTEINNLPRPDRTDPQSILNYNNERAAIADSALVNAEPPNEKDFNGDTSTYNQAKAAYDATIQQLTNDSYAKGSTIAPALTETEANAGADKYINAHNGANNEDDANAVGRDLAELAKTDPAAAAAIMQKVQEKLADTEYGDNAASGFTDNASDDVLRSVAQTPGGSEVLVNLQHHLLSGDVHEGEVKQAQRLDKAVIYAHSTPPKTFTTDGGIKAGTYISAPGTEVPEVTAQYIHDEENSQLAKMQYLHALDQHKDDPQWLNRFYKTLGTDKTAELLTDVGSSIPPYTDYEKELVGQSLQTLVKGGYLNQADVNLLVSKAVSTPDGGLHRGVATFLAQAISGVSNDAAGVQLKNFFAETCAGISTGKIPSAIDNDYDFDEAKSFIAGLGTHALSTTPAENQATALENIQQLLGKDGFANFIDNALKFDDSFYIPGENKIIEDYDGIGTLLKNVSDDPNASTDLQVQLFDTVSKNLIDSDGDVAEKYRSDTAFKEGLGNIFINNQDAINEIYLAGGNGYDLSSDGLQRTNAFFKEVIFTPPLADNAKSVAETFTTRANTVLADADKLSDADFTAKYGKNKHDMTSLVGEQYGVMVHSLKEALSNIKDQSDEDAEQTLSVINGIISAGQIGLAAAGPEGVAVAILGEPLKLAIGAAGDDIAAGNYKDAIDKLKDKGIDPESFDNLSVNDVLRNIDNRVAHDSFRGAFDYAKGVLE